MIDKLRFLLLFSLAVLAGASSAAERWDELSARAQAGVEEFFVLVNARDLDEAMQLMDPRMLQPGSARDAWRRQLEAIRSIHVQDVEPADTEAWTPGRQQFRVQLEAYVADAPDAPIPFYGWQDNPNFRWMTLERDRNGRWLILEIATGP